MTLRGRLVRDERGQGVLVLAVVVVVVAVAVVFLTRTLYLGMKIDDKAEQIAETGRGIASSTDAVIQLDRTQGFGESILKTAQPLDGQVTRILTLAQSIDGLATSINSSAGTINNSANGINAAAVGILSTARSINNGVETINRVVGHTGGRPGTIEIVHRLKRDTGPILEVARSIQRHAGCIDGVVPGGGGHCISHD